MELSDSAHSMRDELLALLAQYREEQYRRGESAEVSVIDRVIAFVKNDPACAERNNHVGHLTGSAWVVTRDLDKVLLMHHRKLNRWMQPGGHADGELDLLAVALREAQEESGLSRIEPLARKIFDIDIHEIPEWKGVPAHLHFDVRFLLVGDEQEPIVRNDESNGVEWVPLPAVRNYTNEESVLRMMRKTGIVSNSAI